MELKFSKSYWIYGGLKSEALTKNLTSVEVVQDFLVFCWFPPKQFPTARGAFVLDWELMTWAELDKIGLVGLPTP